jgi:hypothetical protein
MKVCLQKRDALTPAPSHPMGEGESFAVSLENVSAGFAGRSFAEQKTSACCLPLRNGGVCEADGERAGVRCAFSHLWARWEGFL